MPTGFTTRLDELREEADVAYQALRTMVIDRFDAGQPLDEARLSPAQHRVVNRAREAERALAEFRRRTRAAVVPAQSGPVRLTRT